MLAARERPDKVWLREKAGREIVEKTFGRFLEDALRVSSWLAGQGDGVIHAGLLGSSSIAYITALFGCVTNGNVAVPIDPQLSPPEIMDNLNRADVTVLFYDQKFRSLIESMKSE